MKVLVVYAHPNPQSFSHAILNEFTAGLTEAGHTFDVVDLYGISFDPRFQLEDLAQFRGEQMPRDVIEQQKRVTEADGLAFIAPLYWGTIGAMLIGWFQRVLSVGFAFEPPHVGGTGEIGLLSNQKAVIMSATGAKEPPSSASDREDALRRWLVDYLLKGCGIEHSQYVLFHNVGHSEARRRHLELAHKLGKEF